MQYKIPAELGNHHGCNHQNGEDLLEYNSRNHLPDLLFFSTINKKIAIELFTFGYHFNYMTGRGSCSLKLFKYLFIVTLNILNHAQ